MTNRRVHRNLHGFGPGICSGRLTAIRFGNVEWCPTKRRGHNEAFHNADSIFYHKDSLNETAFVLGDNQYGRIIFNNRYVDPDSRMWYYGWHIYNIVSCDISECKEKMFFRKTPDHEYRQLLDLM